ncbi:MAG: thioredoxin family protein [Rhizobiaceae bacterium]
MLNRRTFAKSMLLPAILSTVGASTSYANDEPAVDDDGIYTQPWFNHESFLVLSEDLEEAVADGKRFAILWEQKGCPYCREMHRVNFAKPEIRDFVKQNFQVLQLNMWGSKKVTDFDGEELEERDLARKWRVSFTPTIVFAGPEVGKTAEETEVMRMPGYFKPFHFISMFEYVKAEAYRDQNFQRFLQDKFKKMEAEGKKPEVW